MSRDRIARIVDAVLYEGYMLYPYRPSSVKNRQRWNFGVVVPEAYHRMIDPSERAVLKTQCLLEANDDTTVGICVRFLQLVKREVDETVEREIAVAPFHPLRLKNRMSTAIDIAAAGDGSSEAIRGEVIVESEKAGDGGIRISVSIANATPADSIATRDDALRRSLLSAHAVLTAQDGAFVSLLDPADSFREEAAKCRQDGLYPVLVGEEGDRESVLAAPIILYDHPQVAPESPDNLFDGTEIDEILTLRIQTLSEEEKREIRSADPRTRELLERAENLEPEILARLHGVLRPVRSSHE